MGKVESNKLQKFNSLLDTAFNLFTTKGVNKTSIAEISEQAGIAKGTFYLYFKDKYDIRNKLISHESSKLFKNAVAALESHSKQEAETFCQEVNDTEHTYSDNSLEYKIIFIINHIIDSLNNNRTLLTFISKNLSWGIFKEALTTNVAENDINFKDVFLEMLADEDHVMIEPEIMLFLITELVSSTCYSTILYEEPANLETIKPYLFSTIISIIRQHTGKLKGDI
ncbi:MAG: TetR/AcrR family transcriptional regulator [Eubacteriales bacterium]|nr:TetR/AcrR family transcriptional regulator [Eubacteriales bacterium]